MTDASSTLDGKRVVVIGSGWGIGSAVAQLAQAVGAEVVIASSRAANVDAAVADCFLALGAFDHGGRSRRATGAAPCSPPSRRSTSHRRGMA